MNYIKELNAFHARQETEPLTVAAAYLWIVLMDINNRAGWKEKFSVAASLLCVKTGVKEGTFKRARNELKEKCYIRVESRGSNRAALYQIISLVSEKETACDHNGDMSYNDKDDHSNDHTNNRIIDPLFKQKETKQKATSSTDAIVFYQENFGMIAPYVADDLLYWVQDVGEPLVLAAMKRALERGKANWGYVKAILQDWAGQGVRTEGDVQAADAAFKKNKAKWPKSSRRTYERKKEVVPDWFKEQKKAQEAVVRDDAAVPELSAEEAAKEKAEVEALLAKHSSGK